MLERTVWTRDVSLEFQRFCQIIMKTWQRLRNDTYITEDQVTEKRKIASLTASPLDYCWIIERLVNATGIPPIDAPH